MLRLENITYKVEDKTILDNISLEIDERFVAITGPNGSGKTTIAVNLAFELKKQADRVAIGDLDIVNPYFRTKDSAQGLAEATSHTWLNENLMCA